MTKRDSNNLRKTTHQGRAFLDIPSGTPEPPLKWEKGDFDRDRELQLQ